MARKPKKQTARSWRRVDLHLHTPASSDYQEANATWLDILQAADARGLDIIGFTDHNTVAGYRRMRSEIEQLELLERLDRLRTEEKKQLAEYRRLLAKILVLPGFEFTATFGFHIIGLFSPETPIRDIEHILLSLNVPSDQLDRGSSTVGATADVLTAYKIIDEAGGLVIAAHVNSSNGVAMRGLNFGGQTKIAYTQDPHLHALEVTDFDQKGRRTTASFFNGSKPEYPRRMHCIQGSDAHRLRRESRDGKNLGIGDRVTEVLIDDLSFESLHDLFGDNDFGRTRPYRGGTAQPFDYVQSAREEGASSVQDFHESMTEKGGFLNDVLCDVCAFANTNGGTLYVGASADVKVNPVGVDNAQSAIPKLQKEIERRITPDFTVTIDTQESRGKTIIRVSIPRGDDPPYAIDDNKIYVRQESETSLAVRDEIVQLVLRRNAVTAPQPIPVIALESSASPESSVTPPTVAEAAIPLPPRTGVEIVSSENRDGVIYHVVRDLRNGSTVKNVTRSSARNLWKYAIVESESNKFNESAVTWSGDIGLIKKYQKMGDTRFDLVQRTTDGLRIYYGVSEDGIHDEWKKVVGASDEE